MAIEIKNFKPSPSLFLTYGLPLVTSLTTITIVLAFTAGLNWWVWAINIAYLIVPFLIYKDNSSFENKEADYLEYLKSCSLRELVRALSDPSRPEGTKSLIHQHLQEFHPGWHEKLEISS